MCGENGTNTESRQAIISSQIATIHKNFREILFHIFGREKPLMIFCTEQF